MKIAHIVQIFIACSVIFTVNTIPALRDSSQTFYRAVEMDNVIALDNTVVHMNYISRLQCASICAISILYESFGFNSILQICVIFNTSTFTAGSPEQGWQYHIKDQQYPAFYASLTQPASTPGSLNFDNTYLNIGSNYNRTTGHFISSHYGVYMFSWTLETTSSTLFSTLLVNGQEVGFLQACSSRKGETDTSTKFVTLTLHERDVVYVYLNAGNAIELKSTFSGWRIKTHGKETAFDTINVRSSTGSQYIEFYGNNLNNGTLITNVSGKAAIHWTGLYLFTVTVEAVAAFQPVQLYTNDQNYDDVHVDGRWNCLDTSNIISIKWMEKDQTIGVKTNAPTAAAQATFSGYCICFGDGQVEDYPYFKVKLENNFAGPGKIKFSNIFLNDGNMYNKTTGEATVFVSGVYLITWITMTNDDIEPHAKTELIVNGEKKGESFSDATACPANDCRDYTTGVALLHLSIGDDFYIYLVDGTVTSGFTVFSGVLIRN